MRAGFEEALEEEAVPHRVDVGDLEAVRGERAGSRAASGADADPVLLREVDEVPDDEEVVGEAHLLDRLELEAQPLGELGRGLAVAAAETLLAELDEVVERVTALGNRVRRQQDAPELELDRAAFRDLERASHGVLEAGEVERHLLGRLEEELVRVELPVGGVLERVAGLDAKERLVSERIVRVEVVDVARRDEREAGLLGEGYQLRIDLLLLREPRILDLDVRRVTPEDLDEPVEIGARVLRAALGERTRDAAGEAARKRHDALRVTLEELPVDARLVVVALEVAERGELDEVRVALVRLREEREVRVPLRLRPAVVGDVDLTADDRLDARLPGLPEQLHRAGERAVVGKRDGRHLEPRGLLHEAGDPARPVEDRVLRVDVQMDKWGGHGKASLLPWSEDLWTRISSCLGRLAGPELVGELAPGVPEIGSLGQPLELPVHANERAEIGLERGLSVFLEDADVPGSLVDAELACEHECAVSELRSGVGRRHALAIGTPSSRP